MGPVPPSCPPLTQVSLTACEATSRASMAPVPPSCPPLTQVSLTACGSTSGASIGPVPPSCPPLTQVSRTACGATSGASMAPVPPSCILPPRYRTVPIRIILVGLLIGVLQIIEESLELLERLRICEYLTVISYIYPGHSKYIKHPDWPDIRCCPTVSVHEQQGFEPPLCVCCRAEIFPSWRGAGHAEPHRGLAGAEEHHARSGPICASPTI